MTVDNSTLIPSLPAQVPGRISITGRGLLEGMPVPSIIAAAPTNVDLNTPEGKALYVNASGVADLSGKQALDLPFDLHRYIVIPGDATDEETGEVRVYPKIVLLNPAGESYGFTSEVVLRRLATLIGVYGPGPWLPPIRVVVVSRESKRSGRTYHDLKIAPQEIRNEEAHPGQSRRSARRGD